MSVRLTTPESGSTETDDETVWHAPPPVEITDPQSWQQLYADCLHRARAKVLPRIRFLQSGPSVNDHATAWLIAQGAADALRHLKGEKGQTPLEVEFAYDSLLGADVMQTMCRHVLTEAAPSPEPRDQPGQQPAVTQQTPPMQDANEWYEIKRIKIEKVVRKR